MVSVVVDDVVLLVVVVVAVVVAAGVVRTSFVVVGVVVLVVDELVGSAPTVGGESEPPLSPALIRTTAIVTAARNATGAPYRVSSRRLRGSTVPSYQPETAHTSRAYFDASAAAALRQSIPDTRKA